MDHASRPRRRGSGWGAIAPQVRGIAAISANNPPPFSKQRALAGAFRARPGESAYVAAAEVPPADAAVGLAPAAVENPPGARSQPARAGTRASWLVMCCYLLGAVAL